MFWALLFLTYYFQINLGYSPLTSGLTFLPFSVGIIVAAASPPAWLHPRRTHTADGHRDGDGHARVALVTRLDLSSIWQADVLPPLALMGMGLVFVPLSSLSVSEIAAGDTGVASAMLNTSQQIGGAHGAALLNTFYSSALSGYPGSHRAGWGGPVAPLAGNLHGYRVAFLDGGCLFAGALLAVLSMIKRSRAGDPVASELGTDSVRPETTAVAPVDMPPPRGVPAPCLTFARSPALSQRTRSPTCTTG